MAECEKRLRIGRYKIMRLMAFQQGGEEIMLQEFKAFIARGNVLDLAVAVIIGAAFGAVVTSFTEDMVMPIIGLVSGGVDFSSLFVVLGDVPADYKGSPTDYEALKKGRRCPVRLWQVRNRLHQLRHHRLCHLPDGEGGQQGDAQAGRSPG